MKWNKIKIGSKKIKSKFLLLPVTIGEETRWLEFAKIEYHYIGYGYLEETDKKTVSKTWNKWTAVAFL